MKYVWYAGYGSNLMRDRFHTYITGGRPPGSVRMEAGCRDRTLPQKDKPVTIPYPLYFSRYSNRWSGGVAFLGDKQCTCTTLGRMYLITKEQFEDVLRQENGNLVITADLESVKKEGSKVLASSWYGRVVYLDEDEGWPVFTFTTGSPYAPEGVTPPSLAYLEVIAAGLRETYGMSGPEIADYLGEKPGVAGQHSKAVLACL